MDFNKAPTRIVTDRSEVKENVAKRIKAARRKSGLSQRALAEKMGASESAVGRWEMAENETPLHQLAKIAEAVDRPLGYFLQDIAPGVTSGALEDQWLPISESSRSEMAVRLRDLVERSESCEIYISASPHKS